MKAFLIEVVIYQALAAILAYGSAGGDGARFLRNLPLFLIITNSIAFAIRTHFHFAERLWGFMRWRRSRQVMFSVPAVVSGCAIGSGLALLILQPLYGREVFGNGPFLMLLKGSLLVGGAVTVLILGYNILKDKLDTEALAKERAKNLQTRAELAALQSKLDPHFLFNTLNTMLNLVHTEPDKVEEMILGLSDIYRKILQLPREEQISLADEFALLDQYLRIERIRLGARLEFTLDLPEELGGRRVLPLLLQPLVENAIKHGIGPKPGGGRILIRAERGEGAMRLIVEDDGVGMRNMTSSSGFGLHSVQERLRLKYGAKGKVRVSRPEEGGLRVILEVPDEH